VIATRTRPYVDPHPIARIHEDALARRNQRHLERKQKIKDLVSSASPDNRDVFFWTMQYDLEHAPLVTARTLILEQGIIPVPLQELFTEDAVHDELWTVIEAMSKCGLFLLNTNHMTDRDLYARLYYKILDEQCRAIPPESEAAEFIDCLHPLDLEHPLGSKMPIINTMPSLSPPVGEYVRGPKFTNLGMLCNRDDYLPRPENP
jgi:hypothetical protein